MHLLAGELPRNPGLPWILHLRVLSGKIGARMYFHLAPYVKLPSCRYILEVPVLHLVAV